MTLKKIKDITINKKEINNQLLYASAPISKFAFDFDLSEKILSQAEKIGCEYIITMDADGQHNPEYIKKVISLLDDGADVIDGRGSSHRRLLGKTGRA